LAALRLPMLENQCRDKHVESIWLPRLDEGSTPSSSTPWKQRTTPQRNRYAEGFLLFAGSYLAASDSTIKPAILTDGGLPNQKSKTYYPYVECKSNSICKNFATFFLFVNNILLYLPYFVLSACQNPLFESFFDKVVFLP